VPETWDKEEKYAFLAEKGNMYQIAWQELQPNAKHHWLTDSLHTEFDTFMPLGTKETKASKSQDVETIFKTYSNGVKTNRDIWAYNFTESVLVANIQRFIATYNAEISRWQKRTGKKPPIDDFVKYDDTKLKWSEGLKKYLKRGIQIVFDTKKVRNSLYRPFCKQNLYFERYLVERVYQFPHIFPTPTSEAENVVICVTGIGSKIPFISIVTNTIPELGLASPCQCFPFYTYDEDGTNRRENITAWAVQQFAAHYGTPISKWDIFHYTYALLHHPNYRARYAENLKCELPRLPLVGNRDTFTTLVSIGQRLMQLHVNYETVEEYPLEWVENKTQPWSWRVHKMKITQDKTALIVNNNLTLRGIPPAAFAYQLGNRSALEWVIDQYQVKTDKRSGITNDPYRVDEPDYLARLVGRVVQVSVETVALVEQVAAVATLPD
jgi:predicted helicase